MGCDGYPATPLPGLSLHLPAIYPLHPILTSYRALPAIHCPRNHTSTSLILQQHKKHVVHMFLTAMVAVCGLHGHDRFIHPACQPAQRYSLTTPPNRIIWTPYQATNTMCALEAHSSTLPIPTSAHQTTHTTHTPSLTSVKHPSLLPLPFTLQLPLVWPITHVR